MPVTTQASSYRWGTITPNALYYRSNKFWPTAPAPLWTETFSAGNASAWPAPWVKTLNPATSTATVTGGIGVLTYGTTGSWDGADETIIARDVTLADFEMSLRIRIGDTSQTMAVIICRMPNGVTDGGTAIHFFIEAGVPTNVFRASQYAEWTETAIGSNVDFGQASNTWYRLRIRLSGATVQARIWADGGAEPSTWMINGTAPAVTAAGQVGVRANGGAAAGARNVDTDDWQVSPLQ